MADETIKLRKNSIEEALEPIMKVMLALQLTPQEGRVVALVLSYGLLRTTPGCDDPKIEELAQQIADQCDEKFHN